MMDQSTLWRSPDGAAATMQVITNGHEAIPLSDLEPEPPSGGILVPLEPKPWIERKHYPLGRIRTTIGRGTDCNVRINHPTVSRNHAELTWDGGNLTVYHLSTSNPTLVNGVPVASSRPLIAGDVIEIPDAVALRLELFGGVDNAPTVLGRRDFRRMYAVLYADVASYSRLVEADEVGTARLLRERFDLIRGLSAASGGRVVSVHGDCILLFFDSAVAAVTTAIASQRGIAALNEAVPADRQIKFRIGINSGDVLITPAGGPHGDAINIAARIESLADAGGILVSGAIHDQLGARQEFALEDIGTPQLKSISQEVRIYRVVF